MDVATWNVLHDGRVVAIDGAVPETLRLSVEIEYLCNHLPTQAGLLVVTLIGCDRFEYHSYESLPMFAPADVAALRLELLSAELNSGDMRVECSDGGCGGPLWLRYNSARVATVEGQHLAQIELESASHQYWSDWQQRNA